MARLILSLTLLSVAALCNADSKSCPGGRQHGDQFEVGRYWYECKDGQTVPMGCLSESGSRIRVQDTFDTQDARMQCVLDGDGYLAILYKSCMADGREHMLGDQWDDGQVWYICKKENAAVRSSPIGCITDGQQIPFDEKVAKADQVYQCKQAGPQRKAEMVIAGCAKNGNKYAIGETYEGGKFWYTCTDSGSKIVGCMHNGQRLKDGDTYHDSDVLYSCKVDGDRTSGVPYGCITYEDGVESEKKFDCFWTEGNAPYQYEMTCKHDRDRNTAVKVKTRCSYKGPEGVFRVEPGCYTHANDLAVGCIKSGSDLETRTFPGDTVDSSYGLRAC